MNSDKFGFQKFNIDAMVTLVAFIFISKTCFYEIWSFRHSYPNNLDRSDVLIHEQIIAILDTLAYIFVDKNSRTVEIDLTMKPLQLVVATNNKILSHNHTQTPCHYLFHRKKYI